MRKNEGRVRRRSVSMETQLQREREMEFEQLILKEVKCVKLCRLGLGFGNNWKREEGGSC